MAGARFWDSVAASRTPSEGEVDHDSHPPSEQLPLPAHPLVDGGARAPVRDRQAPTRRGDEPRATVPARRASPRQGAGAGRRRHHDRRIRRHRGLRDPDLRARSPDARGFTRGARAIQRVAPLRRGLGDAAPDAASLRRASRRGRRAASPAHRRRDRQPPLVPRRRPRGSRLPHGARADGLRRPDLVRGGGRQCVRAPRRAREPAGLFSPGSRRDPPIGRRSRRAAPTRSEVDCGSPPVASQIATSGIPP